MNTPDDLAAYESSVRYDDGRIRAAAAYCSDGRFGDACDDFLHNALHLAPYDRLAVPGGAACLGGHFLAYREEEALLEQLRLLIRVHALERIILIAHQDCAFYVERLHVSPEKIEVQQRRDLETAVERIRSLARHVRVDRYLARKGPANTIQFESLNRSSLRESSRPQWASRTAD
jgi:hypothetical protein